MGLLDVNTLVALAWDAHVHHAAARAWFDAHSGVWYTCPVSEAGFVRVSSNRAALDGAISVEEAKGVLRQLRDVGDHHFLANDVSLIDDDLPSMIGHRQVTDALLLTLASRAGVPLVTFDRGVAALGGGRSVKLLSR